MTLGLDCSCYLWPFRCWTDCQQHVGRSCHIAKPTEGGFRSRLEFRLRPPIEYLMFFSATSKRLKCQNRVIKTKIPLFFFFSFVGHFYLLSLFWLSFFPLLYWWTIKDKVVPPNYKTRSRNEKVNRTRQRKGIIYDIVRGLHTHTYTHTCNPRVAQRTDGHESSNIAAMRTPLQCVPRLDGFHS